MVVCRCNDDVPTLPTSIGMNWHVIVERQHFFDEGIDNRNYSYLLIGSNNYVTQVISNKFFSNTMAFTLG